MKKDETVGSTISFRKKTDAGKLEEIERNSFHATSQTNGRDVTYFALPKNRFQFLVRLARRGLKAGL